MRIKPAYIVSLAAYIIFTVYSVFFNSFYIFEMRYGIACCTAPSRRAVQQERTAPPYVIAIDPGHGGMDNGAEGIIDEIYVCDTTAAYLYRLLEQDENFMPVMTRDADSHPSPRDRARTANSLGADLLISIHANSDSSSASGFECFALPPGRQLHRQSMRFARLVCRSMSAAGRKLRGEEEEKGIMYAYYSGKSKKIVSAADGRVRSRKTFGILENCACPAVLVEQCFVTSSSDVSAWGSEEGCRKAARAYYRAIKEYFPANN